SWQLQSSKTPTRFNLKPGKTSEVISSLKVNKRDGLYFPSSFKVYFRKVFSEELITQYSLTPNSSYILYLFSSSFLLFPGESISTSTSGAPIQPLSSNLDKSHITHISGCNTV